MTVFRSLMLENRISPRNINLEVTITSMGSKVRRQSDIARDDEEKAWIQGMSLKEWHL